jgi:prolyl oligopeptidase
MSGTNWPRPNGPHPVSLIEFDLTDSTQRAREPVMHKLSYPPTRCTDALEERAGVIFPDSYHWLEQDTEEVRHWQRAQGEVAANYVRLWPHFELLKRSVACFSVARFEVPRHAGGLWFRMATPPGATQAQAIVAESPNGGGRVLFDPTVENSDSPPFLSWISPSPDGRTLALGVCEDGSENNTIRLIDVATGKHLHNGCVDGRGAVVGKLKRFLLHGADGQHL